MKYFIIVIQGVEINLEMFRNYISLLINDNQILCNGAGQNILSIFNELNFFATKNMQSIGFPRISP